MLSRITLLYVATLLLAKPPLGYAAFFPLQQPEQSAEPALTLNGFAAESIGSDSPLTSTDIGALLVAGGGEELRDAYLEGVNVEAGGQKEACIALLRRVAFGLSGEEAWRSENAEAKRARESLLSKVSSASEKLESSSEETLWGAMKKESIKLIDWELRQLDADELKGLGVNEPERWEVHVLGADDTLVPVLAIRTSHGGSDGRGEVKHHYGFLEQEVVVEIAAAVNAVHVMLERALTIDEAYLKIREADVSWERYLKGGFSQYPWEVLVNDRLTGSAWELAPTSQWIFMHPSPTVLLDLRRTGNEEVDLGLVVHSIGYLRYDQQRDWYFGGSLSVALPSDDDGGLAIGPTFHIGRTINNMAPVSLGLLWRNGEDSDGLVASVSVDLLQLFSAPDVSARRNAFGR